MKDPAGPGTSWPHQDGVMISVEQGLSRGFWLKAEVQEKGV